MKKLKQSFAGLRKVIAILCVLLCAGGSTAAPKKKPHTLGMSKSWDLVGLPWGIVGATDDGMQIEWDSSKYADNSCEDKTNKDVRDYAIEVFVINTNTYPVDIKLQRFNTYAQRGDLTFSGSGWLTVDYKIEAGKGVKFNYTEHCFSAKNPDKTILAGIPSLADFTIIVSK